jgi:MraZ protein
LPFVQGVQGEVSAEGGYKGYYFSGVDAKDRFTLPVELRHRVRAGSGGNVLHINQKAGTPYLLGFGGDNLERITSKLDAKEAAAIANGVDYDDHKARRAEMIGMSEITFDDGGRFALPSYIKNFYGITDCLFFAGAGVMFEIWAPDRYLEFGEEHTAVQECCRALYDDWLASPKRPARGDRA